MTPAAWYVIILIAVLFYLLPFTLPKRSKKTEFQGTLCLGTRSSPFYVRCIETKDGHIVPPYGLEPKWEPSTDGNYAVVNDSKIPMEKTRNTSYQCWPTSFNTRSVSEEEFDELIRRLAD